MPAPITAIVPPLGCGPAPGAVPFSCMAPMTLAPGKSKPFAITVTMPPGPPPGYWAHNCIAVSAPWRAATRAAARGGRRRQLGELRLGAGRRAGRAQQSAHRKTALNAAKCTKAPGDIILCDYEIGLINDGPSPYHAASTVKETVPAGATVGD